MGWRHMSPPVDPGIAAKRKEGEIIEARESGFNEIEDSRGAELSLTEQSAVPISYSLD